MNGQFFNHRLGLILCTEKDDALVRYAMEGLGSKMVIREYVTALPKESALAAEVARTRVMLEQKWNSAGWRGENTIDASVRGSASGKVEWKAERSA